LEGVASALWEKGAEERKAGKKQERQKKSTAHGYWCEFHRFQALPLRLFTPRWLSVDGNPTKSLPP